MYCYTPYFLRLLPKNVHRLTALATTERFTSAYIQP